MIILTSYPIDDAPAFNLRLPATSLSARAARHAVRRFAERVGLVAERIQEVELAVAEACANAVVHGAPVDAHFEIAGRLTDGAMIITTTDHGRGLTGTERSPGLGLGIPLIAALTDDVAYGSPAGGGTEVRMTFLIPSAPPGPPRV